MLTLEQITIKFGGLIALDHVSMEAGAGRITAVIGPNGAGKTTLFNVITRHYLQNSGSVVFLGQEISKIPASEVSRIGITRTFQNIRIFPTMTVLENALVGVEPRLHSGLFSSFFHPPSQQREEKWAREKVVEALRFMGMENKLQLKAGSLPYGDRRKLEIARALVSDPKLILLDEPAAGMNTTEKEELKTLIIQLPTPERAVILVEHDMSVAMGVSNYVYVLNFGKNIGQGIPAEVQKNADVIKAYLGTEEDADAA